MSNIIRTILLLLSAALGVDVATDIIVDELHDIPLILEQFEAYESISLREPSELALPSSNHIPATSNEEDTRGIGTSFKALAFLIAFVIGSLAPLTPLPNPFGHSNSTKHLNSTSLISITENQHPRLYECSVQIPDFLLKYLKSNSEHLAHELNSLSQEMQELILRTIPKAFHPLMDIKSIRFSVTGKKLVVLIDVAIISTTEELKSILNHLPNIIQTFCKKLLDEKLEAFEKTWEKMPEKSIEYIVNKVVYKQLAEQKQE